ncbi:type I-E CRISPR-associated protein Cse1/CasA [Pantoea sp. 1.19]|uniref:type I-E CRISPR-associated protein Cse1/CasA n=1 Tax=Pantoea sp. 1.19 TaxID=1925589 RepID=UPI0009490BAB|nr:type I-E CRISPR-associated protein Cse1/CasA [Pantoea sp. 1.19]
MDLLRDSWIPVKPSVGGEAGHITLRALLCESIPRQLCLPRDDMELAACQLLISLVQVIWPPKDTVQLIERFQHPLDASTWDAGIADWQGAFDLNATDAPFMQVRGVSAKETTSMDKLMVGLTGSTSCAFVNQPGQAEALCGGCTAIALFNQAGNAPGFGGGFKSGLRGGTPITTLVQEACLRTTLWANVLMQDTLDQHYPGWRNQSAQSLTWQRPINPNDTVYAHTIDLARGLFWQPAHIELSSPQAGGCCTGCGMAVEQRYHSFLKAKFNYTLDGFWLHPHSPYVTQIKKGKVERRYAAFTTPAPSWTQIGRLLIAQQVNNAGEGRQPALTVAQAKRTGKGRRLQLSLGGYRNNQAAIVERRHDIMVFNQGWERHLDVLNEIVMAGLNYRAALRKALSVFENGIQNSDIIGAGVAVQDKTERQYYRQSDVIISPLLATLDFAHPQPALTALHKQLNTLCYQLFDAATAPYTHQPKLFKTIAVARRRILCKQLADLQPQGEPSDEAIA